MLTSRSVTVFGILRLAWLVDISYKPMTGDFSYDIRFVYSAIETNLAIITACAPALRPLLKSWFPGLFASLNSGVTSEGPYGSRYGISASNDGKGPRNNSKIVSMNGRSHIPGTSSYAMKEMKKGTTQIGDVSPSESEEQIMTYDGIVRTREVDIEYATTRSNTPTTQNTEKGAVRQTRFDY